MEGRIRWSFRITTMGIRMLTLAIVVKLCLLNSNRIAAWPWPSVLTGSSWQTSQLNHVQSNKLYLEKRYSTYNVKNESRSSKDWNELILTLQWPQSFCIGYNDSHSGSDICVVPSFVHDWTIHGLWPSQSGEIGPSYCNDTWKFDMNQILDLEVQLNASWPNYLVHEPFDSLWSHEWEKHGTCAASLQALYGEHNYFQSTLNLRQKFDIFSMLKSGGVVPSAQTSYTYKTIFDAVKTSLGTDPLISCSYDSKKKKVYLSEVEFCMDKEFHLVDCVAPKSRTNSIGEEDCSHDQDIFYPLMS